MGFVGFRDLDFSIRGRRARVSGAETLRSGLWEPQFRIPECRVEGFGGQKHDSTPGENPKPYTLGFSKMKDPALGGLAFQNFQLLRTRPVTYTGPASSEKHRRRH